MFKQTRIAFVVGLCMAAASPLVLAAPTAVLKYGSNAVPKTWSPDTPMSNEWAHLFYEMLVRRDPTGVKKLEVSPQLALSWEQTSKALTMKLRPNVLFHDGTPFNAEAVKYNIEERIKSGGYASGNLKAIDKIVVVDPLTVRFDLKTPNPFLLWQLAGTAVGMGSPKAFEDKSIATRPVGTGPYKYSEEKSQPGGKIVLEANPKYWNAPAQKFARIELTPVAAGATRALGLQTGQFEMVRLDQSMVPMVAKMPDKKAATFRSSHIMIMFFDRSGIFKDKRIRQALCYSLNMPVDAKLMPEAAVHTGQRFGKGQYSYAADANTYAYNVPKARALLAEAGVALPITIQLPISDEPNPTIEAMANQAGAVGFNIQLMRMPLYQYINEGRSGKYPLNFGQLAVGDDPYSFYQALIAPDAPFNYGKVTVPEIDAAVTEALKIDGLLKSEPAWAKVNKLVSEEAIMCGSYDLSQFIGYNAKTLKGVSGFVTLSATPYWQGIEPVGK